MKVSFLDGQRMKNIPHKTKNHCIRGHVFNEKNSYWYKHPLTGKARTCKLCKKIRYNNYKKTESYRKYKRQYERSEKYKAYKRLKYNEGTQ